jgi:peptidoglycan/LPS O-acetylase OafA/YrhL
LNYNIKYRPEINGLRAIAIISVIIYHLEVSYNNSVILPKGFLGVDIFFVISGYLIAQLIYKEIKLSKKFNYIEFIKNRAKRILPAFILVLIFTSIFAFIYLLPESLLNFSNSLISSVFFLSNFFFHFAGQNYHNEGGLFKPLLHTWSLSVEVQLYLLFCIFVIIANYFRTKKFLSILTFFIFLSLFSYYYMSKFHPQFNFYFTLSRAWEFLVGAYIGYRNINIKKFFLYNYLSYLGFFLIIFTIIFYQNNLLNYNLDNLLVVTGSVLIMNNTNNNFINKILSLKIFTYIGVISYSLYLWHYPIFSFLRNLNLFQFFEVKLISLVLLIVLSLLSFYLIENNYRKKKIKIKSIFFIYIIVITLSTIFVLIIKYNDGFKNRFSNLYEFFYPNEIDNIILAKKTYNHITSELNLLNSSKFLNEVEKKRVLIIGDSYSIDIFNSFYQNRNLYPDSNFYRMEIALDFFGRTSSTRFNLTVTENNLKNKIFINSQIIILAYRYETWDLKSLEKLIIFLKKNNKKIILIEKKPEFDTINHPVRTQFDIYFLNKYYQNNNNKPNKDDYIRVDQIMFKKRTTQAYKAINEQIKKISLQHSIYSIDLEKYVCDLINYKCSSVTENGYKVYYDYGHYTLEGASFLGKKFFKNQLFKF